MVRTWNWKVQRLLWVENKDEVWVSSWVLEEGPNNTIYGERLRSDGIIHESHISIQDKEDYETSYKLWMDSIKVCNTITRKWFRE